MPVRPMFVCENIFRAKILAERNHSNALFEVSDKTALITGGGSGIGAFMATALSDAGANVLLVGRRQDRLEAVLGRREGGVFAIDLGQSGAATQLAAAVSKANFSPAAAGAKGLKNKLN